MLVEGAMRSEAMRLPRLIVLGTWLLSRVAAYAAGLRFHFMTNSDWPLPDASWLLGDPAGAILRFHAKPPIYPALDWLVLTTGHPLLAEQGIEWATGVVLVLCLLALFVRLGFSRPAAVGLTIFMTVNPSTILIENWWYDTYITATLLVLAALSLHRYCTSNRIFDAASFLLLLAAACLIRSAYHPIIILAATAILIWLRPTQARRLLMVAMIPVFLAFAVPVKNWVMFGTFSSSSWLPFNLSKMTVYGLDPTERHALVRKKILSPVSAADQEFPAPAELLGVLPHIPKTGYPDLDSPYKPGGGPNMNHRVYLAAGPMMLADDFAVIRLSPMTYANKVMRAVGGYMRPPSLVFQLAEEGAPPFLAWRDIFDCLIYGRIPQPVRSALHIHSTPDQDTRLWAIGFFTPFIFIFAFWGSYPAVILVLKRRNPGADEIAIAFCALMILYASVVVNLLEVGETNRMRFEIESLLLVLCAFTVRRVAQFYRFHKTIH